jgi:hypothetical protein
VVFQHQLTLFATTPACGNALEPVAVSCQPCGAFEQALDARRSAAVRLTGALKHPLGHVDADNAARRRGARRLASRQPGSAADVDYLVTGGDP